ncbi:MAG: hypothetical protein JSR67_12125 [Proteobacteria bacterium]|nr:hypothetical protein [Pseudomonadota bacterium]
MTVIRSELRHRTPPYAGYGQRPAIAAAVAAALGVLLAPQAKSQDASSSAQLQSLQQQVQQLQQQITRLQQQQDRQQAVAQAPAANASPAAKQDKGPGLHAGPVTLTFGGYTELATIYRDKNESADVGSNFNTGIPFPNSPNNHLSEFRFSARQSRISMLAQGPREGDVHAEGYFEMDFLGSAPTANSNESNSYNPRLRVAYGTYSNDATGFNFVAGQSWSLATLYKKGLMPRAENVPLTIDAQYVPGFNWTRNPQLRVVQKFSDAVSLGLSLESPQTLIYNGPNPLPKNTVYNNPGGSLYYSGQNYTLDAAPDVIAKLALDPGYGHYELYGVARWFRDRAAGVNDSVSGGGVGAGMLLPLVAGVLDFQLSGLTGKGIGRYGSAQLPDVTLRPDGRFATVKGYQVLAGLTLHPNSDWAIYAYYGREHEDATDFTAADAITGQPLGYGYGSPLYDNSGCGTLGGGKCAANTRAVSQGTVGAWWKYYQGALGNLQVGLQGSYTKRQTFVGLGGEPDVNMTVGMLSFRYYPYQK